MTYQLALATAGAVLALVVAGRAIMYGIDRGQLSPSIVGSLCLLGLIAGAALTPLVDHLGW